MGKDSEGKNGCLKVFDIFSIEEESPSFLGAIVSIGGFLVLTAYMIFYGLEYADNPIVNSAGLIPTGVRPLPILLRCRAPICYLSTQFSSNDACSTITQGSTKTMVQGDLFNATLCYSKDWTNGLQVTIPLGNLFSWINPPFGFVSSEDYELPFPPVDTSIKKRAVVLMERTEISNLINYTSENVWSLSNLYNYGIDCSSEAGLDIFAACYLIQVEPITTTITIFERSSWYDILSTLGGAKETIFSVLGMMWVLRSILVRLHKHTREKKKRKKESSKIPLNV